ncbi:MAG TPA: Xaa-Pro peptidase family protein [Roseiflexaceae bacterium]|nr:Xaa-Pro peptidase family protein [Roseiflexaceae bacterium]
MERLTRLRHAMAQHNLDALAIVPGANLNYLAGLGFTTKLRLSMLLLPYEGTPALVLPTMEAARAAALAHMPLEFFTWDDDAGPAQALSSACHALGLAGKHLGIEHMVMRVFELRALETAAGVRVSDATQLIAGLRMAKDTVELAAMRMAVQIAEEALQQALAQIHRGMTERELAAAWEAGIRAAGCIPSFDIAAGAGPNGASPHHTNSERPLQPGDLVVLDGGAFYQGYASDITRTIAIGEPSAEARRVYELVAAANRAGREAAAQPGASGASIDHAARTVIDAAGYGPYFIHRTGHGLGLEIHEPPFIVGGSHERLPVGATFTVEPGIYLAGKFGVRIEDDLVITADGAETLTSFTRDLLVFGV